MVQFWVRPYSIPAPASQPVAVLLALAVPPTQPNGGPAKATLVADTVLLAQPAPPLA